MAAKSLRVNPIPGDSLRLLNRADVALAKRVPPVCVDGGPTVYGMLCDSAESGDETGVEPFLPEAHVRNDLCDRMRKIVRLRVRLVAGESVDNRGRLEVDAFTREHAGQGDRDRQPCRVRSSSLTSR